MTPAELRAIGSALYGAEWQSPLARALGINARTVRKLVAGEMRVSPALQAAIRALTGATDPDALDVMRPRDEWILGDGAEREDGTRIEYLVHARRPRFVARIAADDIEADTDADRGAGVTYTGDGYTLCEVAWIDPPPGPAELHRLLEAACDAVEREG